jgi:hypothetical protein
MVTPVVVRDGPGCSIRGRGYPWGVLLACPICSELFDRREEKSSAVCGVALVPMERLPPSHEAVTDDGIPDAPEYQPLPATYLRRGRGPLAALALLGVVAFLLPWVNVTLPDIASYSGLELAKRLGWAWGAGVAWAVLVPTVVTRRSIMQMRGARLAAAFLAAVPGATVLVLVLRPPHGSHGVPLRFTYGPGLFATAALSLAAIAVGVVFGGRVDDIQVKRGTSTGQTVH